VPQGVCDFRYGLEKAWKCPFSWIKEACNLFGNESALENAFFAFIFFCAGRQKMDRDILRMCNLLTGQALACLRIGLQDSERMLSNEILMASLLLGMLEMLRGPGIGSKDWIIHTLGTIQLIKSRGPRNYSTQPAHDLFVTSRLSVIYISIMQRKATFLAEKCWRELPWEGWNRTRLDRLVDIVTELPGLLERIDYGNENRQRLLHELQQLEQKMNVWKQRVEDDHPQSIKEIPSDDDEYPFKTKLLFENYTLANDYSIYFAYSLVVAEAATSLGATPSDHAKAAKSNAESIMKMAPYCLQPDMRALGTYIINFPLRFAVHHFEKIEDRTIAPWIRNNFQTTNIYGLQLRLKSEPSETANEILHSVISAYQYPAKLTFICEDPSLSEQKVS
jgi:hypothetical protein